MTAASSAVPTWPWSGGCIAACLVLQRSCRHLPSPSPSQPWSVRPQRGTGRMPSRSIGSLTIVPTSATTCASAEQMPSLPPTWLAALWQRLLPPKRNTKPLTSQMPLGGRRRGVLRRRRDLHSERVAKAQRPRFFHNPYPELVLRHASKLHRTLATLKHVRHFLPVLDRRELRQGPAPRIHTQPRSSRYLIVYPQLSVHHHPVPRAVVGDRQHVLEHRLGLGCPRAVGAAELASIIWPHRYHACLP